MVLENILPFQLTLLVYALVLEYSAILCHLCLQVSDWLLYQTLLTPPTI